MFSYCIFKHIAKETKKFIRFKHKPDHWSVLRKKNFPVDKALSHFDDFYKQIFGKKWTPIREGLLGKQKYVAIVNNYSDAERIMSQLENSGALNIRTLFNLEKEYIQERYKNRERQKSLEAVWKMARDLKRKERMDRKVVSNNEVEDKVDVNHSLESSLSNADLDERRLVDTSEALSTEILHEFIPATKIKGKEDYIPESSHYQFYDSKSEFSVKVELEYDLHFPDNLNIYCFEETNESEFDSAKRGTTGVLDYYMMDGASLLPLLALDLRPGTSFLDMCSAPGGKSLLAVQTLYPDRIVCNDLSVSRVNRIYNVFRQFLYDFDNKWLDSNRIKITTSDARFCQGGNYDRILVDVPCTNDRRSLKENDNNIFKPGRVKERLKLPELQSEILMNALKIVKKGGIVVYSTCSLSPIQNDGVVNMAIKQVWEETNLEFVVKDLSPALLQAQSVFKFADQKIMKYGHLVIPQSEQNYGPMYFCKIQRIK